MILNFHDLEVRLVAGVLIVTVSGRLPKIVRINSASVMRSNDYAVFRRHIDFLVMKQIAAALVVFFKPESTLGRIMMTAANRSANYPKLPVEGRRPSTTIHDVSETVLDKSETG